MKMETKHRPWTDDDGVIHCCFKFWFALPKITSKRVCQGIHNMTRALVRKDKMKIKGTTGNAQRKRKNEKKKKRQGSPRGTTMLITWVSTGEVHPWRWWPYPGIHCSYLGHQNEVTFVEGITERRVLGNPTRSRPQDARGRTGDERRMVSSISPPIRSGPSFPDYLCQWTRRLSRVKLAVMLWRSICGYVPGTRYLKW